MTHRNLTEEQIKLINAAYRAVPETLDALPYTESFERVYVEAHFPDLGLSKAESFKLLADLRKHGDLHRKGR